MTLTYEGTVCKETDEKHDPTALVCDDGKCVYPRYLLASFEDGVRVRITIETLSGGDE